MEDIQTTANTDGGKNKKTNKDKVRSAWISFAGRIVAQLVGAIATVALGVMVLHRYNALDSRPPAAEPVLAARVQPVANPAPPVQVIIVSREMLALPDADQRFRSADRGCPSGLDAPPASAAHFDPGPFLPR